MKVFTDANKMFFYKTDKKVKDLTEIEISSIKEFVFKYSLDPLVLLDAALMWPDHHHELVIKQMKDLMHKPAYDDDDIIEIDFIEGISLKDRFIEIVKYMVITDPNTDFDSDFLDSLAKNLEGFKYKDMSDDESNIFQLSFPDSESYLIMKVPYQYDRDHDSISYEEVEHEGLYVTNARYKLGLTQNELAEKLGWTSDKQISNLETGSRPLQEQTRLAIECLIRRAK